MRRCGLAGPGYRGEGCFDLRRNLRGKTGWPPLEHGLERRFRRMGFRSKPGQGTKQFHQRRCLGGAGAAIETALAAVSGAGQPAPAHCCGGSGAPIAFRPRAQTPIGFDIRAVQLQDQDGAVFSFGDFFLGRASVLSFFYTRCMNPNKCSLTITKLARLQQRLIAEGSHGRFSVASISYDPAFDLPSRLRAYGEARGMTFDDRNRLLRTTGPFEPLQRWLDLGVGFGSTTVNQHRLDIVVLDDSANPATTISRVQWDEDDIVSALKAAHRRGDAAP